jgi:GNAT superfamily N-acetyltransferase
MTVQEVSIPHLPAGFTARPVEPNGDSRTVTALCEAVALATDGFSDVTLQAVRESYKAPGFDAETDARLVFDASGRLSGVVEFYDLDDQHVAPFVYIRVHPDSLTSGIGEALLAWVAGRGRRAVEAAASDLRVALHTNTSGANEGMREIFGRSGWRL